jgi:hypothetical protein
MRARARIAGEGRGGKGGGGVSRLGLGWTGASLLRRFWWRGSAGLPTAATFEVADHRGQHGRDFTEEGFGATRMFDVARREREAEQIRRCLAGGTAGYPIQTRLLLWRVLARGFRNVQQDGPGRAYGLVALISQPCEGACRDGENLVGGVLRLPEDLELLMLEAWVLARIHEARIFPACAGTHSQTGRGDRARGQGEGTGRGDRVQGPRCALVAMKGEGL